MASHERLESRADRLDTGIKLHVAIAAKVSTLHALAGRYTQHLTLEDLSPAPTRPSTPSSSNESNSQGSAAAQRELDAEQERVKYLMKETIAQATHWLGLVCRHFEVELANLPDNPDSKLKMPIPEAEEREGDSDGTARRRQRESREFDIVWELLLVSLGLVGQDEKVAKESSTASSVSAKVGGLFSSSNKDSKPTTSAPSTDAPPPLDYTALSRSLVVCTAEVLGIPEKTVLDVERAIAQFLYFQIEGKGKAQEGTMEWDEAAKEYRQKQEKKGNALKWGASAAGFVLGGVAIGLTGGLAAPALAPVLAGTFGIAAFGGASGAVLIGTLLGLGGGGLAGYRTHRRMKGLEEVSFTPIKDKDAEELPQIPSLTSTIVASGFLLDLNDSTQPWISTYRDEQVDAYALKADPQTFLEGGKALEGFIKNKLITMGGTELIKRTALAAVYAGVALPLTIYNTSSLALDSDFSRCKDKAKKAGVLLAEILEKQVQGKRPAVLVGYGPGASLVLACLVELHRRQLGHLVYSATLISLPEAPSAVAWASARSVVAHELINVYSKNDWVLAIAARLFTLSNRIAGLGPVQVEGISNVDISDILGGHLEIRQKLPQILDRVKKRNELPPPSTEEKVDADELEALEQELQAMTTVDERGKAGRGDFALPESKVEVQQH